MLVSSICSTIT